MEAWVEVERWWWTLDRAAIHALVHGGAIRLVVEGSAYVHHFMFIGEVLRMGRMILWGGGIIIGVRGGSGGRIQLHLRRRVMD